MSKSITPCVFKLKHVPTGQYLLGASQKPSGLKYLTRRKLEDGRHQNDALQAVFDRWDNFEFEILSSGSWDDSQAELNRLLEVGLDDDLCLNPRTGPKLSVIPCGTESSLSEIVKYKGVPGAYILTHRPSGVYYVGSSSDLYLRYRGHLDRLRIGKHNSTRLQTVYADQTEMEFRLIETSDGDEAKGVEQTLLDEHIGNPLCCNIAPDAVNVWRDMPTNVRTAMREGRLNSEKWRAAISRPQSPERIAKRLATRARNKQLRG